MTVNEKGLEAAQVAAREGCGLFIESQHVFCDDPVVGEAADGYGKPLRQPYCSCKGDAERIIKAYLRASSNDAEPVAWTSSGNLDGLRDHDSLVIGSMCNRQGDGWTVPLYLTAIEPVAASPGVGLTISRLQAAHIERQEEWCPDQKPDLSFRGNELGGEAGEAQNVIKKLERERLGWRGSRDTVEHLAEELADVVHTATLCAITAGIDLEPAVLKKFNDTSEKNGLTSRLTAAPTSPAPSPAGGDVLKRYARVKLTGSVTRLPVVRDDGEWVKFSDVADLCAANQKLRALSSKQRSGE